MITFICSWTYNYWMFYIAFRYNLVNAIRAFENAWQYSNNVLINTFMRSCLLVFGSAANINIPSPQCYTAVEFLCIIVVIIVIIIMIKLGTCIITELTGYRYQFYSFSKMLFQVSDFFYFRKLLLFFFLLFLSFFDPPKDNIPHITFNEICSVKVKPEKST